MRKLAVIVMIGLLLGVIALAVVPQQNELLNESSAVPIPCEGVTLDIAATSRELELTIKSALVDYIVYEDYNHNMELEMLQDGKWYVVRQDKVSHEPPAPISPGNSMTLQMKWRDVYQADLAAGQYRLVYTFWAMQDRQQSDNYVVMQEFVVE